MPNKAFDNRPAFADAFPELAARNAELERDLLPVTTA
jgi:hypothetical protein